MSFYLTCDNCDMSYSIDEYEELENCVMCSKSICINCAYRPEYSYQSINPNPEYICISHVQYNEEAENYG